MTVRPEGFDGRWDEVVSGWLLINDFADVTERIEKLADMMKADDVKLEDLTDLQRGTVKLMVERQIFLGIEQGDFDDCFN